MAYWGLAMANVNNEKRTEKFIEKGVAAKAKASPPEALWIDGLAAYYGPGDKDNKTRRRDLLRGSSKSCRIIPMSSRRKPFSRCKSG